MAYARRVEDWNHTAQVMALLVNVNCPKARARPRDFHPYASARRRSASADEVTRAIVGAYCQGKEPLVIAASAFAPTES